MEQNEAEIKSEEKSSSREDEIDLKAQICENSMEQNEPREYSWASPVFTLRK